MRTTYAPPSSRSIDEPGLPYDLRDIATLPIIVFLRSGFGERYVSPLTLVLMVIPFCLSLVWFSWDKGLALVGTPVKAGPFSYLFWATFVSAFLSLAIGRLSLVIILGGLCWCLHAIPAWFDAFILKLKKVAPPLFQVDALFLPNVVNATAIFALAAVLMAAFRIWTARHHPAPHELCVGRSIFERGLAAGASNEARWLMLLFVEPLVCLGIGAVLLAYFANWFGMYFVFSALFMFDATYQRYARARNEVVEAASNIAHASVRLDAIDKAIIEPKPDSTEKSQSAGPFIARPAEKKR